LLELLAGPPVHKLLFSAPPELVQRQLKQWAAAAFAGRTSLTASQVSQAQDPAVRDTTRTAATPHPCVRSASSGSRYEGIPPAVSTLTVALFFVGRTTCWRSCRWVRPREWGWSCCSAAWAWTGRRCVTLPKLIQPLLDLSSIVAIVANKWDQDSNIPATSP
jgi:hypothetical protein